MTDSESAWQRKLDHRLRALWTRVPEPDRERQSIRVLVRVTQHDDLLGGFGMQVHSVAGDIVSGSMMLGDLPRMASAAEILFVELAQPLEHDV